jgi:peptidoglycan L-alanyl-D-glutamate endopeptidase CwlK
MPAFSRKSSANLAECHPDLQRLFAEVIKVADCSVICGARGKADQDEAVRTGKSRAKWPKSYHNVDGVKRKTSHAADVVPYPLDWNDLAAFRALAAKVKAIAAEMHADGRMKHAIEWGGDWKFVDMPHYQIIGADGE